MFYNSSLFSQHQSSLLTPCTSHIFNKDGNDSFLCIAFLSTSITIALLPPVVVAGNAMIWAAVWRKILWGHHFIYLWVFWFFTDLCTGIVAQPFYSVTFLMCSMNSTMVYDSPRLLTALCIVGEGSGMYFIAVTEKRCLVLILHRIGASAEWCKFFWTNHRAELNKTIVNL